MNRNEQLITLRPKIETIEREKATSTVEIFQNETLRPILKFQNDILVGIFKHYIDTRKGAYYKLTTNAKSEYIEQQTKKDKQLHQFLLGVVTGHFTMEEWTVFVENKKDIKKRIINMIIQRLQDQLLSTSSKETV